MKEKVNRLIKKKIGAYAVDEIMGKLSVRENGRIKKGIKRKAKAKQVQKAGAVLTAGHFVWWWWWW